jgi:glycosyltransferase involved in cell wall biosynthesis
MMWRATSVFTPWSEWAAGSLRRNGVPSEKIKVLPPGVDLDLWVPRRKRSFAAPKLQVLFVGGDFVRKGGDILLRVAPSISENFEFHVVTRDAIDPPACVQVHRAEPNSDALRDLYARADLFVLPTRAECFGIAIVEALASGLPCIVGDVGGVSEIVRDGKTGWLIEPTEPSLLKALRGAYDRRHDLSNMGLLAREDAESRFDGQRNDELVLDTVLEQVDVLGHARSHRTGP